MIQGVWLDLSKLKCFSEKWRVTTSPQVSVDQHGKHCWGCMELCFVLFVLLCFVFCWRLRGTWRQVPKGTGKTRTMEKSLGRGKGECKVPSLCCPPAGQSERRWPMMVSPKAAVRIGWAYQVAFFRIFKGLVNQQWEDRTETRTLWLRDLGPWRLSCLNPSSQPHVTLNKHANKIPFPLRWMEWLLVLCFKRN